MKLRFTAGTGFKSSILSLAEVNLTSHISANPSLSHVTVTNNCTCISTRHLATVIGATWVNKSS